MNLKTQKQLAAKIAGASPNRVRLDASRLGDIKESITKADIKGLVEDGAIIVDKKRGTSRGRIRKMKSQKRKGRQKGAGSRKGTANARLNTKEDWMNRIRKIRTFLRNLHAKGKIDDSTKRSLYRKSAGGYFRNLRHVKTYIEDHKLLK